jgi:hypothetical protein
MVTARILEVKFYKFNVCRLVFHGKIKCHRVGPEVKFGAELDYEHVVVP